MDQAPSLDPSGRRRARLLDSFLFVLAGVFGAVDTLGVLSVPGYEPPWLGYAFLASAFLLNRLGRYGAAAAVALTMFPVVILTIVAREGRGSIGSLVYLVLGVALASILTGTRGTILFAGAGLATVAVTPWLVPGVTPRAVTQPFALVLMAAGLAVVSILHRDRLERDRQAEKERLIGELGAKNAELERFTYTVSHDLKSPLVTIRGFLDAMGRDVAAGRTDRLAADLERAKTATDRLQVLLHELLHLSRVGRAAGPFERVDLGPVVREAAGLVQARLEARGVRLEVEEALPEVLGDRSRLVEVVQNLLDNAAKFAGEARGGVVRVGTRRGEAGEPPVLFVQDDGIGIDPRFHEKVFGLFDKLDARSEGSGVGLALVRRIVEVHGGRVWVESEGRGRGTTVCLSLPLPPPAAVS